MTNIYAEVHRRHRTKKKALTIQFIFETVSDYYSMPVEYIMEHDRHYDIAEVRQMAWKFTRELTSISLKAIGEYALKRKFDHTTVLHGLRAIQDRMDTEPPLRIRYNDILTTIKNRK